MVSNEIQIFDYTSGPLVAAVSEGDTPIFKGIEVCRILGIKNHSTALALLDDDERMTLHSVESHSGKRGGARSHIWITESGLYALIFRSRKAEAKRFRKWVTSEVLPTLRRTGSYSALEARFNRLGVERKEAEANLWFAEMRCAELEEEMGCMQPADSEYMTIRDFCVRFKVYDAIGRTPKGVVLSVQWRLLKLIGEHNRAEIRSVPDRTLGKLNTYRLDVLREWAAIFRLRSTSSQEYRAKVRKAIGL